MQNDESTKWYQFGKCCAVISIIMGSIGATLPDPYSKIVMGVSIGLGNAGTFLGIKASQKAD